MLNYVRIVGVYSMTYNTSTWFRSTALCDRKRDHATPTVHCNAYVKAIVHIRYGISFVSSLPGLCLVVTMFGLFSPKAEKLRLHSRIEDLLDVPVIEKDGFSEHICKNCKRKLEHLEKAVEELTDFQHQAKTILHEGASEVHKRDQFF